MQDEPRYILMNKDRKIAALDVGLNIAVITDIFDTIPGSIGNFYKWIESRTALIGRNNILELAKLAGISNEYEFLTISKALSINDTLWVNDLKYPITWSKINPYTNRLSRIMAEIALNGIGVYSNQNLQSPSPQYRIDGSVDKCVKRINGELYIYKTSGEKWSDLAGSRPYSEYYCSLIAEQLGICSYTKYNVVVNKTEKGYYKPYAYCKLFTNETYGLLQIGDSKYKNIPTADLDTLMRKNRPDMSRDLREMLIMDSLTLNIDRHSGNYGFIINNDNYNIIKMAPIYDNDCALGSTTKIMEQTFEDAYMEIVTRKLPRTDLGNYDEMAKWAMTRDIYNKLKNTGRISLGKRLDGLSEKRFKFMEYIVNRRRVEILSMFE